MQQGVHRPRTNAIAMVLEFLDHGQPENRLVRGVYERVNANKACENLPPMCWFRQKKCPPRPCRNHTIEVR
jgi:hypothetical protein